MLNVQILNLVFTHASFWDQYIQFCFAFLLPQHKLQRSDNFSDVFTLRIVDQQVKNNSLSEKGILHFALNHIIKPF